MSFSFNGAEETERLVDQVLPELCILLVENNQTDTVEIGDIRGGHRDRQTWLELTRLHAVVDELCQPSHNSFKKGADLRDEVAEAIRLGDGGLHHLQVTALCRDPGYLLPHQPLDSRERAALALQDREGALCKFLEGLQDSGPEELLLGGKVEEDGAMADTGG